MESDTNSYWSEFVPFSCIYPTLFSGTWPLCFWLAHERGCVTAVQFILFNFAKYPPSIAMELKVSKEIWDCSIHHFHIDHNAPCLLPRLLHNHCFQFLLGITVVPREIEDNGYAKFCLGSKQGALWSIWNWWIWKTNHAAFLMNLYSAEIWTSILSLCR